MIRYSLEKKKIILGIYDMINYLSINNEVEREKAVKDRLRKLIGDCKFLDFCLKNTSMNKSFVCDNLTLIDFLYY